jgi:hypothetical protein
LPLRRRTVAFLGFDDGFFRRRFRLFALFRFRFFFGFRGDGLAFF